jgi:hypothetical protein
LASALILPVAGDRNGCFGSSAGFFSPGNVALTAAQALIAAEKFLNEIKEIVGARICACS